MSRIAHALAQIEFARWYSRRLIDSFDPADWFRMPAEGVTHLAWQVGHLAIAEYFLCLYRLRGPRPDDAAVISPELIAVFDGDRVPPAEFSKYMDREGLLATLDRVHAQVLRELPEFPDAELDSPVEKPHPIWKTKAEVIRWCPLHEMSHAGQIGLLRRLFGHNPIW